MSATIPILTFHAIDTRPSVLSCRPDVFRHGMATLHNAGYRTVGLLEAVECLRQRQPFPDWTFVVTFDDGYRSVHAEAFPVLRQFGMGATVFLTPGATADDRLPPFEGRETLSWPEVREMHAAGIEFGAHTLTHPDLTRVGAVRIAREMRDSRDGIADSDRRGGPDVRVPVRAVRRREPAPGRGALRLRVHRHARARVAAERSVRARTRRRVPPQAPAPVRPGGDADVSVVCGGSERAAPVAANASEIAVRPRRAAIDRIRSR